MICFTLYKRYIYYTPFLYMIYMLVFCSMNSLYSCADQPLLPVFFSSITLLSTLIYNKIIIRAMLIGPR